MTEKTRYRRICDGHQDFLQYEKEVRCLIFFNKKKWFYVPRPYYHTFYGRDDMFGYDTLVCSINTNLKTFVERWHDIEDYFKYYKEEQTRLEEKAWKKRAEIEEKKGVVKILT